MGIARTRIVTEELTCFFALFIDDDRSEYNIGYLKGKPVADCRSNEYVYALRDITAGEELVTAYGSFDTDDFESFGL